MNTVENMISPLTGGKVELLTEQETIEYRGESLAYAKSFYRFVGFEMNEDHVRLSNERLNNEHVDAPEESLQETGSFNEQPALFGF